MKANCWTQKQRKILKNQHCLLSFWSPRYRVSVLSTKYGGCHPNGLIVASLHKINIIIIIIIILLVTRQFSLLLDKTKFNWNSQKTWKICKFCFAHRKNLSIFSKLFCKLHPKEIFNEWWHFKLDLIFQLIQWLSHLNKQVWP